MDQNTVILKVHFQIYSISKKEIFPHVSRLSTIMTQERLKIIRIQYIESGKDEQSALYTV